MEARRTCLIRARHCFRVGSISACAAYSSRHRVSPAYSAEEFSQRRRDVLSQVDACLLAELPRASQAYLDLPRPSSNSRGVGAEINQRFCRWRLRLTWENSDYPAALPVRFGLFCRLSTWRGAPTCRLATQTPAA